MMPTVTTADRVAQGATLIARAAKQIFATYRKRALISIQQSGATDNVWVDIEPIGFDSDLQPTHTTGKGTAGDELARAIDKALGVKA